MKIVDSRYPVKPAAPDNFTQRRWEHSALRNRMLTGNWLEDLEDELSRHIPGDRRAAWGVADMSSNVFKAISKALSVLYSEPPSIGLLGSEEGAADALLQRGGLVESAGLWPIMQTVQLYTIGMREMLLRVDVDAQGDGLLYRPVTPDMVYAEAPAGDPMNPNLLWELRLRQIHGEMAWTYDVFDLRDPKKPSYRVHATEADGKLGRDLTKDFLKGSQSGKAYPYRQADGTPRIPYSIYHARLTGDRLWDPFDGAELVNGSLVASVLHTYLLHMSRDCSHPQRYVMGCGVDGIGTFNADGASRRQAIATDPASILVFSPDTEMQGLGQPLIGQFNAGGDPEQMIHVITLYERKLALASGINPASVQKLSGDPRSGYAIAMSRSDSRDAQRRYAPSFRRGDQNTLELSAIIANRFLGTSFPERGYRVEYSAIPQSGEELEAIRRDLIEKMNAGLITRVQAIRALYPDMSDDEAVQYLREVKRQQIEFGSI